MKRGHRRIFISLAVLSLGIAISAILVGVRSIWTADSISWSNGDITTTRGDLVVAYLSGIEGRSGGLKHTSDSARSYKVKSLWGVQPALARVGFAYDVVRDPRWRWYRAMVPLWFIALLAMILPAQWLRLARGRWRIEKRRAAGLCENCGYDLRASPNRCPECGLESQTNEIGS